MKILVPKPFVYPFGAERRPLFFIAGPIRGGGDWQQRMCRVLEELAPNCFVACPSRWGDSHPLSSKFVSGDDNKFPRQLNWERQYLEFAGTAPYPGCIIFWLPVQREARAVSDGPYAQDTYGELGEWRGRLMRSPFSVRVVVGAEKFFPGLDVIERNFTLALKQPFPIYGTMEETARQAVEVARKSC